MGVPRFLVLTTASGAETRINPACIQEYMDGTMDRYCNVQLIGEPHAFKVQESAAQIDMKLQHLRELDLPEGKEPC